MRPIGSFPFGQPVIEVVQTDRTPKDVFVLGVYASAVHARWINTDGKTVVTALAVASEPYIFWHGENAESIIQQIAIPKELGNLIPAKQEFNGPSGLALDNLILNPLGLDRQKAWLCDLVPHSCVNPSQSKAIERAYLPVASKYGLSIPSVPSVPTSLTDENRRKAILEEIMEAQARVLVVLGDKPIQWFLSYYENRWNKLADFGRDRQSYGRLHKMNLGGKDMEILPLAHPRQIAKLGRSSVVWYEIHEAWVTQYAGKITQFDITG
jgi:uracil-DNA glycosylase